MSRWLGEHLRVSAWASEHHFIRPGADAFFLLALLEHLFTRETLDEAAIRRWKRVRWPELKKTLENKAESSSSSTSRD